MVGVHVGDEGGLVGPGRRRRLGRQRHQHEAGHGGGVVGDLGGDRNETVGGTGDLAADGRVEARRGVGDLLGRGGVRAALCDMGVGQVVDHPVPGLRCGMGMRQHTTDVGQRRPWPGVQVELHRQQHFADDHQALAVAEEVEGRGDAALHRILDRHEGGFDHSRAYRLQGLGDRAEGHGLAVGEGQQSLVGEGPSGSEVSEHALSVVVRLSRSWRRPPARAASASAAAGAARVPTSTTSARSAPAPAPARPSTGRP